ncbi:hypothetical protein EDC94DRAFT_653114 [Helicostylum pulchrum]|nr:hypothetical protein EDC94DRAFT_653114 [Helicostylum pulchrum]
MNGPRAFALHNDTISELFNHISSWSDIVSLLLVSRQFHHVGYKQVIDLPFTIDDGFTFKNIAAPAQMAKVICINCNVSTQMCVWITMRQNLKAGEIFWSLFIPFFDQ